MVIKNKIMIATIVLLFGLGVSFFAGYIMYKMITYPFSQQCTQAIVTGFKVSRNGAQKVENNSGIKRALSGRSPFFKFTSQTNQTIETYSLVPQIFVLFNYTKEEKIKIAYAKNNPKDAVILSYKEWPGIIFLLLFGVLATVVGKGMYSKT